MELVTRNKIELLSTPNRLSEDYNEASDQDDHEDQNGDSIISKQNSGVNNQNVQEKSKKEVNGDIKNTEQTESKGKIVPESLISSDEKNESKNELNSESQVIENKYESQLSPGPEINEQSSFFGYFILFSIVAIIAYLVFHNKQKILALILEGRRSQGNRRRSGGREYRKLDSNLEDTMDSGKEASLRQVIY